jgi:hypothetical protein
MSADDHLLSVFRALDDYLNAAIAQAKVAYDIDTIPPAYRGLYINQEQAVQALQREPGTSPLRLVDGVSHVGEAIQQSQRLIQLQQLFSLSDFDLLLVIMALAPEIDLKYERIYAFLQDDVTRKRPTVELALNLLCDSAMDKIQRRVHVVAHAPLLRQGILSLVPEPNTVQPSRLAHHLKLDEHIIQFLLGIVGLDDRLHPYCQLSTPNVALSNLPLSSATQQALEALTTEIQSGQLCLYLQGERGLGKQRIAAAIATQRNQSLLSVNVALLTEATADLPAQLQHIMREARCQNAILYCSGWDFVLNQESHLIRQHWLNFISTYSGCIILGGQQAMPSEVLGTLPIITLTLSSMVAGERRNYWQHQLAQTAQNWDILTVNALGDRFRLTPEQIDHAIAIATQQNRWISTPNDTSTLKPADLFAAARQQSGQDLSKMAQKIVARYTWDDIVLPLDLLTQLQDVCNHVKYQATVLGEWGFDRKLARGKGVTALFSGAPGTGKTMAAEVIANDLNLDLYKIDLSQVISKYIGETEKNLDRIFTAAHNANAILFFDEADALFGKRSDVKDAHDRYANIEVSYLLQKMEDYEGIAILASNLRQNLDDAFVRRLQAIVEFPFPDQDSRLHLWQIMFPQSTPIGDDVDFEFLAQEIKLAGGNIKNIGLAAAFYAASDGGVIHMPHLLKAAAREHQKLGRNWQVGAKHWVENLEN